MTQPKKEADTAPPTGLSVDIQHLKSLIDLMVQNDLSRLELREGDRHILLRRGQPVLSAAPVATPTPVAAPAPATAPTPAPPAGPAAAPDEVLIRSPMVGTFYAAPEPDAAPFVTVGTVVQPDTVVCLIEAMKVFNEIKAEVAGRITRVLVRNAEAVEYDQPLFAVAVA